MSALHTLLLRQLRKWFPDGASEDPAAFIEAVNSAYHQFDDDRRMLERSLDLSSRELMQANSDLRAIFEAVPDLFLRVDREGRIIETKSHGDASLHLPPLAMFRDAVRSVAEREPGNRSVSSIEYSLARNGGTEHFEARLVPLPHTDEIVVIIRNITQLKRTEERLLHDAIHDALTGLPNRTLFMDRLEQSIRHSKRHLEDHFALLFVDLDRFKLVNDSLGHRVGDELLVAIAERIRNTIRPADTIARLGGDEFTILLETIDSPEAAVIAAERIQSVVAAPFNLGGREIFTTVSIGIAVSAPHYVHAEEMLRDADIAMYRAKAMGRASHQSFLPGMHTSAVALLQLENDLRRALERDEMVLHYQPIVTLADSRIIGFEALMRWNHPQRGVIYPAEFISLAEETGLIIPLGRWALGEACARMRQWQTTFGRDDLAISVNLSGRQLAQATFLGDVQRVLRETFLPPHTLCLEITESMLMESGTGAAESIARLRALGVKVHIDDFGTGYSSLSYLQRFAIDTLKIDRSFISHIATGEESLEIIRTITTLAENLRVSVIAEGVENDVQRTQLLAVGCPAGQGNFFSMPADESTVRTMIGSGRFPGHAMPLRMPIRSAL